VIDVLCMLVANMNTAN